MGGLIALPESVRGGAGRLGEAVLPFSHLVRCLVEVVGQALACTRRELVDVIRHPAEIIGGGAVVAALDGVSGRTGHRVIV